MTENNTRILVIEDDESVRASICITLKAHDFEVEEAGNGEKGLWMLKRSPFDIAIIDMMMPVMDGLETIRALKASFPSLGILAISGGSTSANLDFLKAASVIGATATLHKPFGGAELIRAVREVEATTLHAAQGVACPA